MQSLPSAHCFVQSDRDQKSGFPETMTSHNDSNVSIAESAVDRVFEQP